MTLICHAFFRKQTFDAQAYTSFARAETVAAEQSGVAINLN